MYHCSQHPGCKELPLTSFKAFQEGAPCRPITPLEEIVLKCRPCSSLVSLRLVIKTLMAVLINCFCAMLVFVLVIMFICNWLIVSSKEKAQIMVRVGGKPGQWSWAGNGRGCASHQPSFLFLKPVLTLPWASLCQRLCGLRLWKPQSKCLSLKPLVSFCFFPLLLMVKIIDWPLSELRVSGGMDLESNLSI